ncbi:MAG: hypothetical protein AMS15_00650 [Planctomycetes bacterium DG_23]|nr:MAG: hypothetical protein AMS15_00650 [Planctomycetes bacterium DG_23]
MPIYEYKCEDCGKVSEVFQKKVNAQEKPACPSCGSKRLAKLISVPSVSVKSGPSIAGGTCCGRDTPCAVPPCSDGTCVR